MVSGNGERGIAFYRPAEVTLVLEVDPTLSAPERLWDDPAAVDALEQLFHTAGRGLHPDAAIRQQRTYGRGGRKPLAFRREDKNYLVHTLNLYGWEEIPPPLSSNALPSTIADVALVVAAINHLIQAEEEQRLAIGGHWLLAVAPNWLASVSEDVDIGPCPGAAPELALTGGTLAAPTRPPRFRRERGLQADDVTAKVATMLPAIPLELSDNATGRRTVIVMFDTWPAAPPVAAVPPATGMEIGAALADPFGKILQRIGTLANAGIDLADLNAAGSGGLVVAGQVLDFVGKLADDPTLLSRRSCGADLEEPYDLSDHGLFVASILKDLAPETDLWVYRVFSDRGVSDLDVLAEALAHAEQTLVHAHPQTPVVFNLSLGYASDLLMIGTLFANATGTGEFDSLIRNLEGLWIGDPVTWREFLTRLPAYDSCDARDEKGIEAEILMLETAGVVEKRAGSYRLRGALLVLDLLHRLRDLDNVLLVAAAGNDRCEGTCPPPRIPAAVEGVLGVSATRSGGGERASYSNADDIFPPDDGISALGGDLALGAGPAAEDVIGIFLGETIPSPPAPVSSTPLPLALPNTTGYARWAGTSFATPVVAGFAACLWSQSLNRVGPPQFTGQEILSLIVKDATLPFVQS